MTSVALNEARGIIYAALVAGIGGTSYTFDNEAYDPPADAAWVRLSMRHTGRTLDTLAPVGNRKFEASGSVIVQVFAPLDTGAAGCDAVVETVRALFEGVTLSGIFFYGAVVREIGPGDDWYQTNVEAAFTYNEVK